MDLPLQVPPSSSPRGHQCDSKDHVGFALIFHVLPPQLHCKNLHPSLPLPLPRISTPNRHDSQLMVSGNKTDIEVNLKATGVDGSVTPWSTKKCHISLMFSTKLNLYHALHSKGSRVAKSQQFSMIYPCPLHHIRNSGLTQNRNLGKVPGPPSIFSMIPRSC